MYKMLIENLLATADYLDKQDLLDISDLLVQAAHKLSEFTEPEETEPDQEIIDLEIKEPEIDLSEEKPKSKEDEVRQAVTNKAIDIMIKQLEDPMTPDDFAIEIKKDIDNQNIPDDIWKQAISELTYEGIIINDKE